MEIVKELWGFKGSRTRTSAEDADFSISMKLLKPPSSAARTQPQAKQILAPEFIWTRTSAENADFFHRISVNPCKIVKTKLTLEA